MIKILRLPQVLGSRGKSRSSHYDDIQKGLMTPPVSLGGRSVGWPESEINAINLALIGIPPTAPPTHIPSTMLQ